MSFESGRRRGKTWADVKLLDDLIKKTKFNLTTKSERECELSFANILLGMEEKFNGKIYSQIDQDTSVKAVFCFGKKHRPDLTIDEDGIAIEIKFIKDSLDGIKNAFGQSLMYRLRYKFVINVIIVSEKNKDTYYKADNEEDKDLFDIFKVFIRRYEYFYIHCTILFFEYWS